MSEFTRHELIDLLSKRGYRAEVDEEPGSGYVRVRTKEQVDSATREAVEASVPAGLKVSWMCDYGNKECPKTLMDWWKSTQRYVK